MRVVEVTGNGYEDGLRAGREASGRWRPAAMTRLEKWRRVVAENPIAHTRNRDVGDVLSDLERWTQEDLLAYAAAVHRRKLDALPDLSRFPELKGMDQYLDETARGFAEGAGIDVREVYLEQYWREIFFYTVEGGILVPELGSCSEFFFPDTPNGPLMGKGWDDVMTWYTETPFPYPLEPREITISRQHEGRGYSYASCGVNEAGLCLETGGGARYEYEEKRSDVLFPVPVSDLVLRHCTTMYEAVELLTRYNVYWGPCNCVVGDAEGRGALIEKSKYHYAVRVSDRNVLISTYGGCEDEDMRRLTDTTTPIFIYYQKRLGVMKGIVAEAEDHLNLGIFWKALLHHDPQAPGCQHRETRPPGVELFNFGGFALLPREGRYLNRTIAWEGETLRYACSNIPAEARYHF
jgi:hypothetical protein